MTDFVNASISDKSAKDKTDALKRDFALHVLLISRDLRVSTSEAKFVAWSEGVSGLAKRLLK
jgi:hypothetical protein